MATARSGGYPQPTPVPGPRNSRPRLAGSCNARFTRANRLTAQIRAEDNPPPVILARRRKLNTDIRQSRPDVMKYPIHPEVPRLNSMKPPVGAGNNRWKDLRPT